MGFPGNYDWGGDLQSVLLGFNNSLWAGGDVLARRAGDAGGLVLWRKGRARGYSRGNIKHPIIA